MASVQKLFIILGNNIMESMDFLFLAIASPFSDCSSVDLLVANARLIDGEKYSCSEVVLGCADRHILIKTEVRFLPKSAVNLLSDVEKDDPDFGSYVSVLASLKHEGVAEGTVLQGRFGPSILTRLPDLGKIDTFDISAGVYKVADEARGRNLYPVKLSGISDTRRVTITLLQHGLFGVVIEPK